MVLGQKEAIFVGCAKDDLAAFPDGVKLVLGYGLFLAQTGRRHPDAKPLKGFGGAGVLEIVDDDDGETYRAVYTVKFAGVVYVLHCFQKKSKKGNETPKKDMNLINTRLKLAREHYEENFGRRRQKAG